METWRETFRSQIVDLERFLLRRRLHFSADQAVYLAGMLSRLQDRSWMQEIQPYLLESPQAMAEKIRVHEPYIGQNAPVFFVARINGEYLTLRIITGQALAVDLEKNVPQRYFLIAARYADRAGQNQMAGIYRFVGYHYDEIIYSLMHYMEYLASEGHRIEIPPELWQRFGKADNERNNRKEGWERMRVEPSRRTHISRAEFNDMINFGRPN